MVIKKDKIKLDNVDTIYVCSSIPILSKVNDFLFLLSNSLEIEVKDILEFFGIKAKQESSLVHGLALNWDDLSDTDKEELKIEYPDLDFEEIALIVEENKQKQEKFKDIKIKFYSLFKNFLNEEKQPIGLYSDFLDILEEATEEKKEKLFNSSIEVQIELFSRIFFKKVTEAQKGFFCMRVLELFLNDITI